MTPIGQIPRLNGYARLSVDVRKLFALLSFSARGAEAVLRKLLEGDRFLSSVTELHECLQSHLTAASEVSDLVWSRLADVVGCGPWRELKHDAICACATTFAYIDRDVFSCVRSGALSPHTRRSCSQCAWACSGHSDSDRPAHAAVQISARGWHSSRTHHRCSSAASQCTLHFYTCRRRTCFCSNAQAASP